MHVQIHISADTFAKIDAKYATVFSKYATATDFGNGSGHTVPF